MLDSALRDSDSKVFVAHLNVIDDYDIAQLKLGKKATEAYAKATELHKQLDRYAYGGPRVRFSDEEVDQARAAGVTIEFEHAAPLIVDRSLYRELVKQAIARTVSELEAAVAEQAAERQASRNAKRSEPADPLAEAERDERRQLRVCGEQAHGVNLDLGAELLNGLSTVDPADMTVARFFVLGRYRPSDELGRPCAYANAPLLLVERRGFKCPTQVIAGSSRGPGEAVAGAPGLSRRPSSCACAPPKPVRRREWSHR